MNEQELRRAASHVDGFMYVIGPLLAFGIAWLLMKLVLGDGDPKWANAVVWASMMSMAFVMFEAAERGSKDPLFARIALADRPKTKTLATIKMAAAAVYTVLFGVVFALSARPYMSPWLVYGIPTGLSLIALPTYFRQYQSYAKHFAAEAEPAD